VKIRGNRGAALHLMAFTVIVTVHTWTPFASPPDRTEMPTTNHNDARRDGSRAARPTGRMPTYVGLEKHPINARPDCCGLPATLRIVRVKVRVTTRASVVGFKLLREYRDFRLLTGLRRFDVRSLLRPCLLNRWMQREAPEGRLM